MTAIPGIGGALAQSLVEALGPDCATGALVARVVQRNPGSGLDAARLHGAPAGATQRVLRDFAGRGWIAAEGEGWICGPGLMPAGVPAFLDGAAAMYAGMPHDGRATTVVTFPTSSVGIVRALPRTGFSYAGLMSSEEAFDRIADAATTRLTVLTPFLNDKGLDNVLELFRRTSATDKNLVVRRYGGALATARARLGELEPLGVEVRNYTVSLPKGFETFHAKVVIADHVLAYVGSANMTRFERRSMELGIMVDGKAAKVVASVVRAVEMVSEIVTRDGPATRWPKRM
ncbi:MAG TPA: phospholipase D-like domain-containing protein [Phenylobacterium sp.]|uniref:phospholipase D-like domain-containing protein n=1 Tax=Phenylobacterium sp. TaxID=1871053 RepID=UPI002F93A192